MARKHLERIALAGFVVWACLWVVEIFFPLVRLAPGAPLAVLATLMLGPLFLYLFVRVLIDRLRNREDDHYDSIE